MRVRREEVNSPARESGTLSRSRLSSQGRAERRCLPRAWRITGGYEAMIGVLLFGWSTAALVAFLHYVQDTKVRKYFSAPAD